MHKPALLLMCFLTIIASAQPPIHDDMESYTNGELIYQDHWTTWSDPSQAILSSSEQAYDGSLSGKVSGNETTSAIFDMGNRLFGNKALYYSFWMFVPSNKEASFNLQGEVPISGGQNIVGNFYFNKDLASPGSGFVEDTAIGEVSFSFPHDQWFNVRMSIDLTAGVSFATWRLTIDEIELLNGGTPFTNEAGTIPTSLGGTNFNSISPNSLFYLDEFWYREPIFDIDDNQRKQFTIAPNPVHDLLTISSEFTTLEKVVMYSATGTIISSNVSLESRIDLSNLPNGIYFLELYSNSGKEVHKVIKQ